MARYRATEQLVYVEHGHTFTVLSGEDFEFSATPSIGMAPLDAEAVVAKVAAVRLWRSSYSAIGGQHTQNARQARSLGFQGGTNAEARAFIEAWVNTPTVVLSLAPPPSPFMPSNFQGPPGYQHPSEKWR